MTTQDILHSINRCPGRYSLDCLVKQYVKDLGCEIYRYYNWRYLKTKLKDHGKDEAARVIMAAVGKWSDLGKKDGRMERCEWNPMFDKPSSSPLRQGDCQNQSTLSVGHKGQWHLCNDCARRQFFKRFKSRKLIHGGLVTVIAKR